jgi:hypothetical protein
MNENLNTHQAFESTMSAGSLSSLIDLHRSEKNAINELQLLHLQ